MALSDIFVGLLLGCFKLIFWHFVPTDGMSEAKQQIGTGVWQHSIWIWQPVSLTKLSVKQWKCLPATLLVVAATKYHKYNNITINMERV